MLLRESYKNWLEGLVVKKLKHDVYLAGAGKGRVGKVFNCAASDGSIAGDRVEQVTALKRGGGGKCRASRRSSKGALMNSCSCLPLRQSLATMASST